MCLGSNHKKWLKASKNEQNAVILRRLILQGIGMPKHQKTHIIKASLNALFLMGLLCFFSVDSFGQTTITAFNTATTAATSSTTTVTAPSDAGTAFTPLQVYDIHYGEGNDLSIIDYTIGGTTYDSFLFPDTLVIRRTDGSNFINIWYSLDESQGGGDGIDADEVWTLPSKVDDADAIYLSKIANGGYDNILVNDDDLAGATIQAQTERVDIIWYSGIQTSSPTTAVYPVIERGGNDHIKIAGITALDANGDPSAYTQMVEIDDGSNHWTSGATGIDIGQQVILRRQTVGDDPIPLIRNGSQDIYGAAVSFDELGIAAGEVSYGFSIFGADVNDLTPDFHDLVDFATFPNTTLSSVSGLDLVASLAAAVASDDELIPHTGPGGYKAALSTWLKANDGAFVSNGGAAATDGSSVGFWEDQALGQHDFSTLGVAPTFRSTTSDINFNPTVDFIDPTDGIGLNTPDNTDFNDAASYTNKGINIAFRTSSNDISTKQQLYEQGEGAGGCSQVEQINSVSTDLNLAGGGSLANLYDGILTAQNLYFNYAGLSYTSDMEIFNIEFTQSLVITEFRFLLDTEYSPNASFMSSGLEYQVEGFNGATWDDLTGTLTASGTVTGEEEVVTFTNTTSYTRYRLLWTGGSGQITWNPWLEEILFTATPCVPTGATENGIGIYIDDGDLHMSVWNRDADAEGDWNDNGGGSVETVSTAIAKNTEYILTLEFAGDAASSGSGSITGYLNGQSIGSLTAPNSQNIGLLYQHSGGEGALGNHDGDSRYDDGDTEGEAFYGEIPEFIYCNEPSGFSLAVRQRIESYLALKYGITLDQSTAYNYVNSDDDVIFNTTDGTALGGYSVYNNDIAGIGRDDNSVFEQIKSKSENKNSRVTIDKGASIGVNDTWLIWGNDGADTTETTSATMPDTISSRIERVWRVAEENEMGEVSLSFDLSELGGIGGLPTGDATIYSLLIAGNSSLADFSSATILTGGIIVGSTITFSGVSLEDGEFFTLGTGFEICAPGGLVPNLTFWLKADDGTMNSSAPITSGTVDEWTNSIYNVDFGEVTLGGGAPALTANGVNYNPEIYFDGSDDELLKDNVDADVLFSDQDNTIFYVLKSYTEVPNEVLAGWESDGSGDRMAYFEKVSPGILRADVFNDANKTLLSASDIRDYYVISTTRSDASDRTLSINGIQEDNATTASSMTAAGNTGDFALGARPGATNFAQSNVSEMIIYKSALTAVEIKQVESYLALKYGITLTNDNDNDASDGEVISGSITEGDYVASDGTTIFWNYGDHEPTFINDVAGIGRDDAACFEQRQSSSENDFKDAVINDDIVAMGLGEISVSNSANPNTIATDLNYLLWANDDDFTDQANANTSDLPTGVTERMERIWKVQETGTVAATTISFDLSGLGYSSTATDFQLIVSGTTTMAGGTLYPAASLVGGILTFNNIDLTDGQFFTIGTGRDVCAPGGVTAGLILALRGEAGITGTTVVTAWEDQSAAANDMTATTGPELITNGINFNPSLQFNGTNETMAVVSGILGTSTPNDLVVFAVTEVGTVQNSELFYEDLASAEVFSSQIPWGDANAQYDYPNATGGVGRVSGAWGGTTGSANIWTMFSSTSSFSTASGNINKGIFRDGILVASNTSSQTGTGNNSDFNIGSNGTSNFYDADISEILIYSTAPSPQELEQIQTYLAIKYGIFKDSPDNGGTGGVDERDYFRSDATVIWDYSNNASYHRDLAGIGRDDDACLNQKQSSSEGTDDILTIGLGDIAVDNASNVNSFMSNGDFMVWGNDDGATAQASVNTSDVPGIVEERMERIWRVDETGTVGDTEISFDLTGLGYTTDPNDFQLIISSTSTMATGITYGGGTFNGNVLTFTGVDFADGDYFTIGTSLVVCGPGGVFTNLELWLRADLGTSTTTDNTDLSGTSAWLDQSVNANNGAETNLGGGTPVEPTYQTSEINFNPVISFLDPNSTNSSYINTTTNTVSGDMTLISLFRSGQDQGVDNDFVNTPALIGANASGANNYGLGFYDGEVIINANENDDAFDARTGTTYNDNNTHLTLATRLQSSGALEIFMTGETQATGTGSTAALADPTSFGIGNHSDSDIQAQFNGDIAETIVFSSVLTGEEQSRVETYLALKYGLTISDDRDGATPNELISGSIREGDYVAGDGDVVWDYLNQGATYYNDIFGIARDDLSCFDQPQSKSENDDAMVTFDYSGTGFATNDAWLISGNDNAPIEAIDNTERPLTINSRLNREWRVQETGTVGTIELTYDLSSVSGPSGIGSNNLNLVRLMVDDDGDFSNGGTTLIAPSSIDGGANTVTFDVDFTNGQYYTLGSTEVDALPITLIAFDARTTTDNQVEITWATAQEINNSFYTIERSKNGTSFETVGFKEGAGNSSSIIDYTFLDQKPLDGISYYRLKQTDFNGQFEYSELSRVYVDLNVDVEYKVVPNPVNRGEVFKVNYPVSRAQDVNVLIASANGGMSISSTIAIKPEDGYIEVSTTKLAKGLYIIRIVNNQLKQVTLKFIVN
jgi:hypothetical protein